MRYRRVGEGSRAVHLRRCKARALANAPVFEARRPSSLRARRGRPWPPSSLRPRRAARGLQQ
eukprot:2603041-Pleurochrysis_carterae.AAC.1